MFKTIHYSLLILIIFFIPKIALGVQAKQYLITTASSGFGIAISAQLAHEGYSLILAGRDEKKLNRLKADLEVKYGGKYYVELFDYTNIKSINKFGEQIKKYNIDGIVVMPPRSKINTSEIPSSEEWSNMFQTGFIAPLEIIKQTVPALQKNGSIVIISGLSSVNYLPEYKNSNVLRKMWIAESKNLVYQLEDQKIRVNCISPYIILTDYHNDKVKDRALKNNKSIDDQLLEETTLIPLQRYGQPEDIAQATAFLLSNKSSYINGINLVIDGGLNKAY